MMLGLAAFAGIAAVSEGFAVSPAATRSPLLGQTSSAFAADAAAARHAGSSRRRRGMEMVSQATGAAGASTQNPVYDQESWAMVRISLRRSVGV